MSIYFLFVFRMYLPAKGSDGECQFRIPWDSIRQMGVVIHYHWCDLFDLEKEYCKKLSEGFSSKTKKILRDSAFQTSSDKTNKLQLPEAGLDVFAKVMNLRIIVTARPGAFILYSFTASQ